MCYRFRAFITSLASTRNSYNKEIIGASAWKAARFLEGAGRGLDVRHRLLSHRLQRLISGGEEVIWDSLGSRDLNSSAPSLVIPVGSSGKADTAVWHPLIRLPIVSPPRDGGGGGQEGKWGSHHHSPPALSLSVLLCLLYPLWHFSRPTRPLLIQKMALQMQIWQMPVKAHRLHWSGPAGAADWSGPCGEGHGILAY